MSVIIAVLHRYLPQFEAVSLGDDLGLSAFTVTDFLRYLANHDQFNWALRRRVGQNILYGVDHGRLRRSFFNELPKWFRLLIFQCKCSASNLISTLEETLSFSFSDCVDVKDIGMGHSIYKISLISGKEWVVKKKDGRIQEFYTQLLRTLSLPSYISIHIENAHGQWEVTEFLGAQTLNEKVVSGEDISPLVKELATHAALGDLTGRGDRHLENYVVVGTTVFPLDIAYLFWPNNEEWTYRYTKAGCYELNVLISFAHEKQQLKDQMALFWTYYEDAMTQFLEKKESVYRVVKTFFKGELGHRYSAYLSTHFDQLPLFISSQKKQMKEAFDCYHQNRAYKEKLALLMSPSLEDNGTPVRHSLKRDFPRLWMYYLADKNRNSCFLHLGETQNKIFALIDELMLQFKTSLSKIIR